MWANHYAVCQGCGEIVAAICDRYYTIPESKAELQRWRQRGNEVKTTQEQVCVVGCKCSN